MTPATLPGKIKRTKGPVVSSEGGDEAEQLAYTLLPRKRKELYRAMMMGNAAKKDKADALRAKAKQAKTAA